MDLIKSVSLQPAEEKKRVELNMKKIRLKTVYLLRKLQYSRISLHEFHRFNLFPKEEYHFGLNGRLFLHLVKTNNVTDMSRMLVENPFLVHDFDTVVAGDPVPHDGADLGLQKKPLGNHQNALGQPVRL